MFFPTTSDTNKILLLFDVTDNNDPKFLKIESQACSNLECFGDFDSDGRFDYASWNTKNKRLNCFSLDKGQFELRKGYLVFIASSNNGEYWIDEKKTKWFFEITAK